MSRRLWPVLLLVPLGVLVGHQLAYALPHAEPAAGAVASHSHGHLGLLGALALPLAALAATAWLRGRGNRPTGAWAAGLAGGQVAAFATMELIERVVSGGGVADLARSPVLWVGVGTQVAVALAAVAALRTTRQVVGALLLRMPPRTPVVLAPAAVPFPGPAPTPPPPERSHCMFGRGPPALFGRLNP